MMLAWMLQTWEFSSVGLDEARSRNNSALLASVFPRVFDTLCMPPRGGIAVHKNARAELEIRYGPMWFIKMPWKPLIPGPSYFKATQPSDRRHKHWVKSLNVIGKIDADRNGFVSAAEIGVHLLKDGADPEQIRLQISEADRSTAPHHVQICSGLGRHLLGTRSTSAWDSVDICSGLALLRIRATSDFTRGQVPRCADAELDDRV